MSDDEDQMAGSEEEEEEEEAESEHEAEPEDTGPSPEAQLAMQRRRAQVEKLGEGLDDQAKEILNQSREERERMEEEIIEMRARSDRRKKERVAEERRMAVKRNEEEALRKSFEEERRKKKEDEERRRKEQREARLSEHEKHTLPQGRNFVIKKKKEDGEESEEEEEVEEDQATKDRKSREQQEQEKKAIMSQRIKNITYSDLNNTAKLVEKAKELHAHIVRLESEKYDLEKRYKSQQYDMMELAERARQMNQVSKEGNIRRLMMKDDETDRIQERFAGAPARIEMYSRYERQKDKRNYGSRHEVFHGPTWLYPATRIAPARIVQWDDDTGLPIYTELDGTQIVEEELAQE